MKNLVVRTITGAIFVALVVASLFLPPCYFYVLFLTLTLVGTWEFIKLSQHTETETQLILPLLLSATLFTALYLWANAVASVALFATLLVLVLAFLVPIVEMYRNKPHAVRNVVSSLFPALWIALPLGLTGFWLTNFQAANLVLAMLIVIWAFDSLAYCAGSIFGKHPLFERISPKKSWEGTLISLFLTMVLSTLFFFSVSWSQNPESSLFYSDVFTTPWHWMGFALVIIVASSYGDLVESMFKRNAQIKDSGKILPGHGGVLDRLDSLFFAAPFAFIYWIVFYSLNFN